MDAASLGARPHTRPHKTGDHHVMTFALVGPAGHPRAQAHGALWPWFGQVQVCQVRGWTSCAVALGRVASCVFTCCKHVSARQVAARLASLVLWCRTHWQLQLLLIHV